ncbi:MAG: pyridine nucleotide-disulfide oxidoreductase [Betaproteobacteria bacterium]|nr:pyridine nucleotide-disulfide oxidoreductase [Betaproteobacteria bacterium]
MTERVVIVGAGQAAGVAAVTLREQGYGGAIAIVGEEAFAPYQRPPLSKHFLAGQMSAEQLLLKPEKFYAERNIELKLGTRVDAIERDVMRVRFNGGETLAYSKLLLATGSRPRKLSVPGADLAGVHYLRTLADVQAIRADMAAGKRAVVIGAGYIGLEAAAVAAKAGMNVVVLEAAERILGRVSGPIVADFFAEAHRAQGAEIHCGMRIEALEGSARVASVVCNEGPVAADLVIVGIGIDPNVELAAEAGLACDNGIVVDEFTRTADPNIHAAGDCSNHPNALLGARMRLESVQNAIDQARAAASNLAGKERAYAELPWFWSNQYDLRLQIAGLSQGHDGTLMRGSPAARAFSVMYLRAGRLIAVDTVNAPRDHLAFRKLLAAGGEADAQRLVDPAVAIG